MVCLLTQQYLLREWGKIFIIEKWKVSFYIQMFCKLCLWYQHFGLDLVKLRCSIDGLDLGKLRCSIYISIKLLNCHHI